MQLFAILTMYSYFVYFSSIWSSWWLNIYYAVRAVHYILLTGFWSQCRSCACCAHHTISSNKTWIVWFLVLPYWECHALIRTVCSDSRSPVLASAGLVGIEHGLAIYQFCLFIVPSSLIQDCSPRPSSFLGFAACSNSLLFIFLLSHDLIMLVVVFWVLFYLCTCTAFQCVCTALQIPRQPNRYLGNPCALHQCSDLEFVVFF